MMEALEWGERSLGRAGDYSSGGRSGCPKS